MTIPVAFDVVAEGMEDLSATTRRRVRDQIFERHVIERSVSDIYRLLGQEQTEDLTVNVVSLWDYQRQSVAGGANYATGTDASWLS